MDVSVKTTLGVFLLAVLVSTVTGLECFNCATTSHDDWCVHDHQRFINESRGLTKNLYRTNCTADKPTWNRCMIETREQNGVFTHYHRGCHDGKTFNRQFNSSRFHNLNPTNKTVCDFVITLTCYTFCDTDLCNGPQAPPNKTTCDSVGPYDILAEGLSCGAQPMGISFLAASCALVLLAQNLFRLVGS